MRWYAPAAVVLALVCACSNSHKQSDALKFDGTSGACNEATNHAVGDPCVHDGDCTVLVAGAPQGICFVQSPFTCGYCSAPIDLGCPMGSGANSPCPNGDTCIQRSIPQTSGNSFCIKNCTTDSDCRTADGFKCCMAVLGQTGPFCWPSALCM